MAAFSTLDDALYQAANNLYPAAVATFRETIRRTTPRFRDQARKAAGADRVLSRGPKSRLDVGWKILPGRSGRAILLIKPIGPWGIRDSTDGGPRTAAHLIKAKRVTKLKFMMDGEVFYKASVNHRGSRRSPYWKVGREEAFKVVQQQLPKEMSDAIRSALNSRPYKNRT